MRKEKRSCQNCTVLFIFIIVQLHFVHIYTLIFKKGIFELLVIM